MQACSLGGMEQTHSRPPSTRAPHCSSHCKMPLLLLLLMMVAGVAAEDADLPLPTPPSTPLAPTCFMRGVCGDVRMGANDRIAIPCAGPFVPQPLQSYSTRALLAEYCPMFKENEALCCDDANVESLVANFKLAAPVLGNCEVCFRNFRDLWCQYTCSPRQSQFVHFPPNSTRQMPDITGAPKINDYKNGTMVDRVDFHVKSTYIRDIFKSCMKTHMLSTTYSLGVVCQMPDTCIKENPTDECIQGCLEFLGTAQTKTRQPLNINFIIDKTHTNPSSLTADNPLQKCHESSIEYEPCACSECFTACPATPKFLVEWERRWTVDRKGQKLKKPEKSHPSGTNESEASEGVEVTETTSLMGSVFEWMVSKSFIYEYPWYGVISFVVCCIFGYAVIGCFLYRDKRRKTEKDAKEIVKFAGTYWGARDMLDNAQRAGANWYAKVAADSAGKIGLFTCAIVIVFCCIGIPLQEFVSDPIKVWTQAGSRARIEKDNFENYFGPTPRYTQVIIKPIHTYTRPFRYGNKNYGPVFHHFVLQQAFKLTQSLLDLRGRGVHPATGKKVVVNLTDVCYKMVDDHCFVMSPMSYFQNNQSILECMAGGCSPELDESMKQLEGKGAVPEQGMRSLLRLFPNGTERYIPREEIVEKKVDDEGDVFDDLSDEDIFKRRKREVSVHPEHRVRAKRNHPIEAPTARNDSQYEERLSQQAVIEGGFGVLKHLIGCIDIPVASYAYLDLKCGSQMGGAPVPGNLVFGDWYRNAPVNLSEMKKIVHYSSAYLITIGLDAHKRDLAEIWEKEVINMLKKFSSEYVEVSFITQYSIQDEINKAADEDVRIIGIGYVLMAIYIVFGLSQFSVDSPKGIIKHTVIHQIFPGIMVTVTITASVLFVMAFYGMIGVSATLMCLEVQPFLLCAIGVNNIFYFVKTYQRKMYERRQLEAALFPGLPGPNDSSFGIKKGDSSEDENEESLTIDEERRAKEAEDVIRRDVLTQTCQRVLPSMFCTAFTECVCFLSLGLSSAPVLKVFSWYASAGVIVNFFFTLTIFVPAYIFAMKYSASPIEICSPIDCVPRKKKGLRRRSRRRFDAIRSSRGWMPHLLENYYAPYLFTKEGRYASVILQALMITISIIFIPQLKIGLDEKMSVPKASYVHKFMSILPDTLATSMPVHFVVHSKSGSPLDVGNEKFVKLFCTDRADCDKDSLGNLIGHAVRVTQTDLIAQPAMNWFDDYRKYRSVKGEKSCCLRDAGREGQYCTVEEVNQWTGGPKKNCSSCIAEKENPFTNMTRDLRHFTVQLPTRDCSTSGGMAHREAINFTATGEVNAFYLRSFHRTFRNSSDFIEGLRISRDVCDEFRKVLDKNGYQDIEVYPFSFYYLFYDQYLYIAVSTSSQLALSAGIAFIGLTLTTVSPTTAVIVAANTLSSTLLLIAYMVFNGIELNALTIVNLAMSLGIGLEFSVHLCFAYANSGRVDRIGRATDALVNVGSTVFSGIVFTKFLGIIVLYNVQSQIFGFYYFDFYVGLLPIGVCHGFVFLPVMLTFWGPDTYLRRYVEQNEKASLTGGDQQGSEEGRADSMSSPRSMPLVSAPTSKASSRGLPPSYGRMAAAISPATTQMNAHDHSSNGDMESLRRLSSSPCMATVASTIDHENAPLVVREDSLRSNDGQEAV